ncbi:MAG: hypothetical protein AB4058_07870 [Microcystaceae cyanobacterium]
MSTFTGSRIKAAKPQISSRDQRRYVRYENNQGRLVNFSLRSSVGSIVIPSEAILLDESFGGAGLLILTTEDVHIHQICYMEVSEIGWVKAQIIWVTILSDELYKRVGIRYLNE